MKLLLVEINPTCFFLTDIHQQKTELKKQTRYETGFGWNQSNLFLSDKCYFSRFFLCKILFGSQNSSTKSSLLTLCCHNIFFKVFTKIFSRSHLLVLILTLSWNSLKKFTGKTLTRLCFLSAFLHSWIWKRLIFFSKLQGCRKERQKT